MKYSHSSGKTWNDSRYALCATCTELFSSLTTFDAHRTGDPSTKCVHPSTVDLTLKADRFGTERWVGHSAFFDSFKSA